MYLENGFQFFLAYVWLQYGIILSLANRNSYNFLNNQI